MTRKLLALTLVILMMASFIVGCGNKQDAQETTPSQTTPATEAEDDLQYSYVLDHPVDIVLASQGAGTDDYITTALEAQLFSKYLPEGSNVTHETISPGCSSLGYLIEAGMADFGTGQNAMSGTIGLEGKEPYQKVNALIGTKKYPFVVQLVNNDFIKKTGYTSLREIIENKYPARICAEPIGSSDYASFMFMMDILGCTVDEFKSWGGTITYAGGSACCEMLQDGQADIMIAHATAASSSIVELCMSTDTQAFGLDDDMIKGLVERGYAETVIPSGTYDRFTEDTPSACQASSKIVSSDMPNEVAYALTKILCEHVDELGEDLASYRDVTYQDLVDTRSMVVPMHPGAKAYFQDIGVLDNNGNYIGEPTK